MSPKGTLFFDEWQACLRAHYLHVLRTGDHVTEPTLRRVLRNSGLTDEDIAALHREAEVEPAPPEEEAPAPAAIPEPEDAGSTLDDDDLLRGDESDPLADSPPTGEPDWSDDLPPASDPESPDDAPPIPDGPPPPSQLSLF